MKTKLLLYISKTSLLLFVFVFLFKDEEVEAQRKSDLLQEMETLIKNGVIIDVKLFNELKLKHHVTRED